MTLKRIRDAYDVPATRGRSVLFCGRPGQILSADRTSAHLWLRWPLDGTPRARVLVHPTWELDYLDGRGVR